MADDADQTAPPGSAANPLPRTAARVVPVADGACLLLLERDPVRPQVWFWNTAGGAVDPGESLAQGAARELREETGIAVAPDELVGPVHQVRSTYSWNDVHYAGDVTFFALDADRDVAIDFAGLEAEEVGNVGEARWLTPAEVAADGRLVRPDLPEILARAVEALDRARSGS